MLHIVYQQNDKEVLKQAMDMDPSLQGEIVQIADDWAVGPIRDIFTAEGRESRKQWWREVLQGGDYEGLVDDGSVADDHQTVGLLLEKLRQDPAETLWIWAAQNSHDVCGYYWLISQLRDFQGRIFILYLNNLPFINNKGHIFYPVNLFDIPPREFLKAKKLARPVTLAEFEVDPDEWQKLCAENKGVRILEGGKKLKQYDDDFYDATLKGFITADWQKGSRIIQHFLAKANPTTGDAYLLWRLKFLITSGGYDVQGELKKMKDFEIKSKSLQTASDGVATF